MVTAFMLAERARRAQRHGNLRLAARLFARASRQFDRDAPTPDHLDTRGQLDKSWKAFWEGCAATCDDIADHPTATQ